jgi:hypothetical protein
MILDQIAANETNEASPINNTIALVCKDSHYFTLMFVSDLAN